MDGSCINQSLAVDDQCIDFGRRHANYGEWLHFDINMRVFTHVGDGGSRKNKIGVFYFWCREL